MEHTKFVYKIKRRWICVKRISSQRLSQSFFWNRLKEYEGVIEEEKLDVGYYLAQSWHKRVGEYHENCKVIFWIDKELDEDWVDIIRKAAKIIMKYAPWLSFSCKELDKMDLGGKCNQVKITKND